MLSCALMAAGGDRRPWGGVQDDDVEVGALWDPAMSWRPPSWLPCPAPLPSAGAAPAAGCQHAAASSDHSSSECTTVTTTTTFTNTSAGDGGIGSRSCSAELSGDGTAHEHDVECPQMQKAEAAVAASPENVEAQEPHLRSSRQPSDAVCILDDASDLQEVRSDASSSEAETDTELSSEAEAVARSDSTIDGQAGDKQPSTGSNSLFGRLDALFAGGSSSSRGDRGAAGRGHPHRDRGRGTHGGRGSCDSSSMDSFALRAGALQLLQHGCGGGGQGGTELAASAPHAGAAAAGRGAPGSVGCNGGGASSTVHNALQMSSAAVTAKQQQAVGGDSNRNPVTVLGRLFPGSPGTHACN